ncbi:amino acid ABC transporter substrate-binding protein, PAAT family [Frankia torreyi]|uniref:Amino acid ABC transporter substrate-binding protein, PAAT family n=1 Tax=Frankia torreyi TaxID=1856 RepID=A0A0D8BBN2_9ACTN|nr:MULTISPECIES: transporter substrate-binding domain-containing protein [Frankia]KJE21591.1 amino acid ABC transporter substrate-binding protein, PAAT family [Frankia torreyi]KQC36769.1 ABC transporter substrate-binding protein [Frankia sp. ACN1ag]KQM03718.1 amino acid ABC transporter substrate-binding protein, PAAT family [Frankia sp. CpI1-P]
MPRPRRLTVLALAAAALLALASCAGSSGGSSSDGLHLVKSGQLTVATDSPAYAPWFSDGKPANGKGFESAVAFAVAAKLGFAPDKVHWVTEPFNSSFAPGPKKFDFDINEISITPQRQQAVDFSTGYYDVSQAVVALKSSRIADVKTLAGLKGAKFGAPVGTTSLDAITRQVAPVQQPAVFNDLNDAKTAMENGPIDGIVVDLPTAFQLTSAEIPDSLIVGQFPTVGAPEQFGLLFEKGNPLVRNVNDALAQLTSSGELRQLTEQWLGSQAGAPVLR